MPADARPATHVATDVVACCDDAPTHLALSLLRQADALAAAHQAPGAPPYARPVGAHLRHVVEHFEALLAPAEDGVVDYDARDRDAALEASPALARARIAALQAALARPQDPARPLRLRGLTGPDGGARFEVPTSHGRELAFVASHAVHHFALLAAHCRRHALPTPEGFGIAPATLAHARAALHALQQEAA